MMQVVTPATWWPPLYWINGQQVVLYEAGGFKLTNRENQGWGLVEANRIVMPGLGGFYLENDILYLTQQSSLQIFDVRDRYQITKLSETSTRVHSAIQIKENIAYILGNGGFQLIDITHLANPVELSFLAMNRIFLDFSVAEKEVYVSFLDEGVKTFNTSNVFLPNEIISKSFSSLNPMGITTVGDLGYIDTFGVGLTVMDLTNSTAFVPLSTVNLPDAGWRIAGEQNAAYVQGVEEGLWLINVSDPQHPEISALLETPAAISDVYVKDSIAYILSGFDTLWLINVTSLAEPTPLGAIIRSDGIRKVQVSQNNLYLSDRTLPSLIVFKLEASSETTSINLNEAQDILSLKVQESVVYLADYSFGLKMLNITDPTRPTLIGDGLALSGGVTNLAVNGNIVYVVGAGNNGVTVVNVATLLNPRVLSSFIKGESTVFDIEVVDQIAYVAMHPTILCLFNVSDPYNVVELSRADLKGNYHNGVIKHLRVRENIVYAAGSHRTFWRADISNPFSPHLLSITNLDMHGEGLALKGGIAYLAMSADHGLWAFDVSNPAEAVVISSISNRWHYTRSVEIKNYVAYVSILGEENNYLWLVDITNPTQLKLIESKALSGVSRVFELGIKNNQAYIAADRDGVSVVDVREHESYGFKTPLKKVAYWNNSYWTRLEMDKLAQYDVDSLRLVDVTEVPSPVLSFSSIKSGGSLLAGLSHHSPVVLSEMDSLPLSRPAVLTMVSEGDNVVTQAYYKVLSFYTNTANHWALNYEVKKSDIYFNHLALSGELLAVSLYTNGIELLDFSLTGNGELIATLPSIDSVTAMALEDERLYVADPALGIVFYDVSRPAQPEQIGLFLYDDAPLGKLHVEQALLFANAEQHLLIIDAFNPQQPILLQQYDAGALIEDFVVHDNRIALVQSQGLKVLRTKNDAKQWLNQIRLQGTRPALDKHVYQLELTSFDYQEKNAALSTSFNLHYHHLPLATGVINDMTVRAQEAVSRTLNGDLLFEEADQDVLTFSMEGLPSWLSFDSFTQQLSGVVPTKSQGVYPLTLQAIDTEGGEANIEFKLLVVNQAPVVDQPLLNQQIKAGRQWQYSLPANSFVDADDDQLSFTVKQVNGAELPAWLTFFANNQTFVGSAPAELITYNFLVRASDAEAAVSQSFSLTLTNSRPEVVEQIPDVVAEVGKPFAVSLPAAAIVDQDDVLTFILSQRAGVLPSWLLFDAQTFRLTGLAPRQAEGSYTLRLRGSDGQYHASTDFSLDVISSLTIDLSLTELTYQEEQLQPLPALSIHSDHSAWTVSYRLSDPLAGRLYRFGQPNEPLYNSLRGEWRWQGNSSAWQHLPSLAYQPALDYDRQLTVAITVEDGVNYPKQVSMVLIGEGVNDGPRVVGALPSLTLEEEQSLSRKVGVAQLFSDPDGDALTYRLIDSPSWLTYDAKDDIVAGQAPSGSEGRHQWVILASDGRLSNRATGELTITSKAALIETGTIITALLPVTAGVLILLALAGFYRQGRRHLRAATRQYQHLLECYRQQRQADPMRSPAQLPMKRLNDVLKQFHRQFTGVESRTQRPVNVQQEMEAILEFALAQPSVSLLNQFLVVPLIDECLQQLYQSSSNGQLNAPLLLHRAQNLRKLVDILLIAEGGRDFSLNYDIKTQWTELLERCQQAARLEPISFANSKKEKTDKKPALNSIEAEQKRMIQIELARLKGAISTFKDNDSGYQFFMRSIKKVLLPGALVSEMYLMIARRPGTWYPKLLTYFYQQVAKSLSDEASTVAKLEAALTLLKSDNHWVLQWTGIRELGRCLNNSPNNFLQSKSSSLSRNKVTPSAGDVAIGIEAEPADEKTASVAHVARNTLTSKLNYRGSFINRVSCGFWQKAEVGYVKAEAELALSDKADKYAIVDETPLMNNKPAAGNDQPEQKAAIPTGVARKSPVRPLPPLRLNQGRVFTMPVRRSSQSSLPDAMLSTSKKMEGK